MQQLCDCEYQRSMRTAFQSLISIINLISTYFPIPRTKPIHIALEKQRSNKER